YDHGIEIERNGNTTYFYGGDFGDEPNNGNYCVDGLIKSNRELSNAMKEVKQVFSPIKITKDTTTNNIFIENLYNFTKTEKFTLNYSIKTPTETLSNKTIELPSIKPRSKEIIALEINKDELQEKERLFLYVSVSY